MLGQLLAGSLTALLVSPFNVVVDKSVMLYTKGVSSNVWKPALEELKTFLTPLRFVKKFQFRWMTFVYIPTYVTSNCADHFHLTPLPKAIEKLLLVFLVNTTCSLIKDKIYNQRLGQVKPRPYPLSGLGCFFARDLIAMYSAFTLPPIVAQYIHKVSGFSQNNSLRLAQVACPLGVQVIATPIHLLGLDLYNREQASWKERVGLLGSKYVSILGVRMLRFLPAYGLGGIANTQMRKYFKDKF